MKIGFLGCGLIASAHASNLAVVDEAAIDLVYDIDAERAARFADETGGTLASSVVEVIDGSDAVYVTTWTSEHASLVEQVVAAGKAVFCEKPLGVDLAAAKQMCAAVEHADVINQVGLVLRRSPAFRWMQHQMTSGEFGTPMSIVFRDDQYIPIQGMYGSTWRGDRALAGSGTLLEHSIHDLDLIEWMLGPIERVSCTTANVHGIEGIEDQATVMLTAANGASAVLSSTWHDVMTRPSQRHVEGFCQNGYIELAGDWYGPIGLSTGNEEPQHWHGADVVELAHELDGRGANADADFVDCILNDRPAYPDFTVALRAHVLADAAYRSAANGSASINVG